MSLYGQMYNPKLQQWKRPEAYRTYMKINTVTRFIKEVLEPMESLWGFPNRLIDELCLEGFPHSINRLIKQSVIYMSIN